MAHQQRYADTGLKLASAWGTFLHLLTDIESVTVFLYISCCTVCDLFVVYEDLCVLLEEVQDKN